MASIRSSVRAVLAVGALALGCSDANLCPPEQICKPRNESNVDLGYYGTLRNVCFGVCQQAAACGIDLLGSPCFELCLAQRQIPQYWSCEPFFRELLECYSSMGGCDGSACAVATTSYYGCMGY